jgi:predicted XRE-type DNA-binding protein
VKTAKRRPATVHEEPSAESLEEIPPIPRNAKVVRRGPRRDYLFTLALLREVRELKQAEVASAMGVTQGRVSQLETKAIDELDPQWSTLTRYAAALGGDLELRVVLDGRSYKVR